jgi:CelD/BcsL family acetyltransferase involved in cellulose biosynthesis
MTALIVDPSALPSALPERTTGDGPQPYTPFRYTAAHSGTPRAVTGAAAGLVLDLVTDRLAFNALEADWVDLFARSGRGTQMFQSFAWLWHWSNHFLVPGDRSQSLAIVTGRRDGRLVVVLPFVKTASKGLSHLSFMGDPVSQYGDALVDDGGEAQSDLRAAWAFAIAETRVDAVHLRKVRADAAIARLLEDLGANVSDCQQAPYVAFDGITAYAAFEQRYPKPARKNRKRQLRRLQDGGETNFERLPAGDGARDAASVAMALKRNWLFERGQVSAALSDPRTEAFFRDCASGRGPATGVEVGLVSASGAVAAVEIAVRCKDRVAIHVIAYNPQFEKAGAGALLMEDSIRRACEGGVATLDLMAPGAGYKFDWADRAIEVRDYAIGLNAPGRLYTSLYVQRVRPAAKSAVEKLPTALRRHFASVIAVLPGAAM